MRKPFIDANAKLTAAGYLWDYTLPGEKCVFGGEHIVVIHSESGTYHNRGPQYVPASTAVHGRFNNANDYLRFAVRNARKAHADLFASVERVPRSDRQAQDILDAAARIDHLMPAFVEAARESSRQSQAERAAIRARLEVDTQVGEIARVDLVNEVMRLDAEGLLDESNALAGLKRIVDRIRQLRAGEAAEDEPSSPAP